MPVFLQNCFCTAYGVREHRKRFGGRFQEYLGWLEETQWWSLDRLIEYQNQYLRKSIELAYRDVPFWKDRFKRLGVKPGDIRTTKDLANLPILTKAEVRDAGERILNPRFNKREVATFQTSGSTGTPLKLVHTHECVQFQRALWWRHRHWYGVNLKCREANFGGKLIVRREQQRPPFWRHNWRDRQTVFSQYHLKPEFLGHYVEYLSFHTFDCFAGFPSVIYVIADYLEQTGKELLNRPKVVFAGSENTEDFQRNLIEKHIAPVTGHYGGAEYASLASRCPQGVYHIDMECGVLEIVPVDQLESEPGKITGNVVVTGFMNSAMPLIRYDMADLATLLLGYRCPCGRQSPVLERIDGRNDSYLVTADGRRIGRISRVLMGRDWIKEAQIIQNQIGKVAVKVIKRQQPSDHHIKELVYEIQKYMGQDTSVDIKLVENIPRTAAGKFKAVISRIGQA